MSRRISLMLSVVLIGAFALSACGAPTPAAAPTQAPAQPAATQAPAQKVTVNWWHISTKDPGLSDWQ